MMKPQDPLLDHRARLEHAQREAAERREQALTDQRSPVNTPEQRVRIWEKLHQVRMPRDPSHVVLMLIAQQTGLALIDVQEVQRLRLPVAT